jgi:orotate phosphoribosyltransferase-like protein
MTERPFSDWGNLRRLIMLRGLGFSQREIANDLKVSQSTIAYQLRNLRKRAIKENVDMLWTRIFPQYKIIKE